MGGTELLQWARSIGAQVRLRTGVHPLHPDSVGFGWIASINGARYRMGNSQYTHDLFGYGKASPDDALTELAYVMRGSRMRLPRGHGPFSVPKDLYYAPAFSVSMDIKEVPPSPPADPKEDTPNGTKVLF